MDGDGRASKESRYLEWVREAARRPDDASRAVLADLIGEEDPELGTFVQLQLTGTQRVLTDAEHDRMVAILEARHADWLAPVASGLRAGHYGFRRGFLEVVVLYPESARHARELARSPLFATVTQLGAPRHLPALLQTGAFPSLRTLGTHFLRGRDDTRVVSGWGSALPPDTLHGIRVPRHVRGLQVDLGTETRLRAFFNAFGRAKLEGVRELGIVCHGRISRRVLDEFPRELERLSLAVPRYEIDTWISLARRLFPGLRAIDVVVDGGVVTLRPETGWEGLLPVMPTPVEWGGQQGGAASD